MNGVVSIHELVGLLMLFFRKLVDFEPKFSFMDSANSVLQRSLSKLLSSVYD